MLQILQKWTKSLILNKCVYHILLFSNSNLLSDTLSACFLFFFFLKGHQNDREIKEKVIPKNTWFMISSKDKTYSFKFYQYSIPQLGFVLLHLVLIPFSYIVMQNTKSWARLCYIMFEDFNGTWCGYTCNLYLHLYIACTHDFQYA